LGPAAGKAATHQEPKGGSPYETLYLSEEEGAVEAGWWSPDPMELQPDKGEKEYLISLLMGGSSAGKGEREPAQTPAAPNMQSRQTDGEGAAEEGNHSRGEIQGGRGNGTHGGLAARRKGGSSAPV
jgi:hypothetical protein